MIWLTNLQWNTAGDSSLSSLQKRRQALVLHDMEWRGGGGVSFTPSGEIARRLEQVKWLSEFWAFLTWVLLGVGYIKEEINKGGSRVAFVCVNSGKLVSLINVDNCK